MGGFQDGSARIVLVEPSSSVRSMLAEALKQAGYSKITPFDSLKAALGYLEVEPADWVITSLFSKTSPNAVHLLDILSRFPHLSHVRVSLFLEEIEKPLLPVALEAGLMSWHSAEKKGVRDQIVAEIANLRERFVKADWNEALLAASYAVEYLDAIGAPEKRIELISSLAKVFPDSGWVMSRMVEHYHKSGMEKEKRHLLAQMQLLGLKEWEETAAKVDTGGERFVFTLGIETCVVIDPDESVQSQLKSLLGNLGVSNVISFSSGEDVIEGIKSLKTSPDLILQEWKIPKVTGSVLIQRLRQAGYQTTPIVVLSSLVHQQDSDLLVEFGVSNIIEKPLREEYFIPQIIKVLQQTRNPSTHAAIELRIQQLLQSGDISDAERLREKLRSSKKSVQPLVLRFVDAQIAYAKGRYGEAREMALDVLRNTADHGHVRALGLLGRSLSKLHDYENAAKCFQRAQQLSPRNIERLCELASVQSISGNLEGAASALAEAKSIDPENTTVVKTEATLAVHKGDIELARSVFAQMEMLPALVSDLNNQAVSLIHTRNLNAGVELYRKTLALIPPSQNELVMKVKYNLALAHIRFNFLEKGRDILNECRCEGKFSVERKIRSLLERIEVTIERGIPLVLTSSDEVKAASSSDAHGASSEIIVEDTFGSLISARPGERCCHLLMPKMENNDPLYAKLMSGMPPFKPRKAIAREMTHGADKAIG